MSVIELRNLSFGYTKDNMIIKNINLQIHKDTVTAITGPNGSGKTTLGKLMMGILRPSMGHVFSSNKNISNIPIAEMSKSTGYLFQNPEKHFFSGTVEDELGFVLRFRGEKNSIIRSKVEELLYLLQLEGLEKSSPLLLSQGEKQRLAIATILINEPEYLILDEPTKGLDVERKEILINVLKGMMNRGIGMTIMSHDDFLINELSKRNINIQEGEIAYDKRN